MTQAEPKNPEQVSQPIKAVRTVTRTIDCEYDGHEKPKHAIGDYMEVYSGSYQGHCFVIKDIRYNHDIRKFQYLYGGFMGGWYAEGSIVPAGTVRSHYDSQGYCDNPGRGF